MSDRLAAGDPAVFAPDFLKRLTRMERKHISRAYGLYVARHAADTSASPAIVAKEVIAYGVQGATWFKTTPVMVAVGFLGGGLLGGGSIASVVAGIVLFAVAEPLLYLRIPRRKARVVGWFIEAYPESLDESTARGPST